jgi:UDP-N-acetylmuramoyl-tripeptide--D-alanyl-D-alanine ligase
MRLTTAEVASITGGQASGPQVLVEGVAIDSRQVTGGELFVPLQAARDGHGFIPAALSAGAAAYLTSRPPAGGSAVRVESVPAAYAALGAHARCLLDVDTVAITGSVGKTTTKDLVAAVLGQDRRVHASQRSFNNAIGVPFTLINAPAGAQALVLEIGANAPGEIAELCAMARPTVGVVTKVAPAHTLGFGSVDGVARAKAELVAALPSSGLAVLNVDDARVSAMAPLTAARVLTFGMSVEAEVRVVEVEMGEDLRPRVKVATPWGPVEAVLAVRGAHQAYNAAAAVAVGGALGVGPGLMAAALAGTPGPGMRMDLRTAANGLRVLDDSYNASPVAVEAALVALAAAPARRRVAVLGVMAELGEDSAAEHLRLAQLASRLGIEVLAVGAPEYGVEDLAGPHEALARLAGLGEGDIVLVKGSRQAGLEELAAALAPSGHNGTA